MDGGHNKDELSLEPEHHRSNQNINAVRLVRPLFRNLL